MESWRTLENRWLPRKESKEEKKKKKKEREEGRKVGRKEEFRLVSKEQFAIHPK